MSARLLLEISIRVLGLWFALDAVVGLMSMVPYYLSTFWNASVPNATGYLVAMGLTHAFRLTLSAVLVLWAPGIAARFYPAGAVEEEMQIKIGPGDVYRTVCFVLGAYLLVHAVLPACRVVIAGYQGTFANWPNQLTGDAVTTLDEAGMAAGRLIAPLPLVFRNNRMSGWFNRAQLPPRLIEACFRPSLLAWP